MIDQSPRVYVYKITFLEVEHYYYGSHLEKKFDEEYWGSPVTHKNYWELYTPQKEIIKEFPYTDEGYIEAQHYEKSLIRPVYNTDPLCLNENCGGKISLKILRESGRRIGRKNYENKVGCFSLSPERRSEVSRKVGLKNYENGVGVHNLTTEQRRELGKKTYENGNGIHKQTAEQRSENGKKAAEVNRKNGTAIFSMSSKERSEAGKKGGKTTRKKGVGIFNRTEQEMSEHSKKIGQKHYENGTAIFSLTREELSENGKKGGKKTNTQKWKCTVTGYISTPGGLSGYQKARGIDTSNRIRIQ